MVYLWAEEVRDKPQGIAELWLFVSIVGGCVEAAELGNVARRGGRRALSETTLFIIAILTLLAFLAGFGADLAHKYFVVDALDPSSSQDPSDCKTLTLLNTIFIGVSIGLYGLMTVAGIYGTIIASGFETEGKHSGFHKYRRYWSVLIVAFLTRSMLGLAFVMIFDWFNMDPYDLLSMIYAIIYSATTIVIFFCICRIVKIPNPMRDNPHEAPQEIPMTWDPTAYVPPNPWGYKPAVAYTQIPSDHHVNRF